MRRSTDQELRATTEANEQELSALIDLLADKDPTVHFAMNLVRVRPIDGTCV